MKKIMNAEVNVVRLGANDILCTSGDYPLGRKTVGGGNSNMFVSGRYDDEEEEW